MLNSPSSGGRPYQEQVPAVARAIRVLETLAMATGARSLADLARDVDVSPSSLLAILTTLRHAGLVTRTNASLYQIGPGVVALGTAAACKLRACERFAAIADTLLAATGETALLWIRQEHGFVLAAAREGTQSLRYVPTPGVRLRNDETTMSDLTDGGAAAGSALADLPPRAVIEEILAPGVWMMAAALPSGLHERACIALAGPPERLATPANRAALLAACHATEIGVPLRAPDHAAGTDGETPPPAAGPDTRTWGTASASLFGSIEGAELDAFLGQSLVATLSYLADDGYPATVPLWYAWDGEAFWLASRPGSEWAEHISVDPRISLAVSESTPPLRRVMARGCLIELDDPGGARWAEIESQLAARYAGFDAAREPAAAGRGRLFHLKPERLIAWRGLLRYPKLPPEPEGPGATAWRHLG